MKRQGKIVLKKEDGLTIFAKKKKKGELIITEKKRITSILAGEYAKRTSVYTDETGNTAIIPKGWTVSGVKEENKIWGKNCALVIYRIPEEEVGKINWEDSSTTSELQKKYDQFVWVPVTLLQANGTLDSVVFNEKFGRRDFSKFNLFNESCYEPVNGEFELQVESVQKYGGFYFARYQMSYDGETGKYRSVRCKKPTVNCSYENARELAYMVENNKEVKCHLIFGAEYDSVLQWFVDTEARTLKEICEDSSEWGNYCNSENSKGKLLKTGSSEKFCTNCVYDIAGNALEWTQERNFFFPAVIVRSGRFMDNGSKWTASNRTFMKKEIDDMTIGFRVALYIK